MERRQPFFSVIVPTYRRPQQLATCLASLAKLEYPGDRFEVIVVDDGGGGALDAVVATVRDALPVTLLRQPHVGPSGARNAGAVKAKGDYLVFTADDCMPAVNWLSTLAVRAVAEPDSAVGGAIINALSDNHYSTATHLLIEYLYSYYNALPGAAQFFTPNNLAVPTDRYHAIGGFNESFVRATGEDREFCDRWTRHGYRMLYDSRSHRHACASPHVSSFCPAAFQLWAWDVQISDDADFAESWTDVVGAHVVLSQFASSFPERCPDEEESSVDSLARGFAGGQCGRICVGVHGATRLT